MRIRQFCNVHGETLIDSTAERGFMGKVVGDNFEL